MKYTPIKEYINSEDLIEKSGYKREKDRGLSVVGIRQNKRETILTLASASQWSISWLQKQLDKHFGFKRQSNNKERDENKRKEQNK